MKAKYPKDYTITKKGFMAFKRGELFGDKEIADHLVSVIVSDSEVWGVPESIVNSLLGTWLKRGYITTSPAYLKDLDNFYSSLDSETFGKDLTFLKKNPDIIVTQSGPTAPIIIKGLGYKWGLRLPYKTHSPLDFADLDYKNPELVGAYLDSVKKNRPSKATVLDVTTKDYLKEALREAKEIAPYVDKIVIIPKYSGAIKEIPEEIEGKKVLLGYSVKSSYGSTDVPLREFGNRPVHLLGGSPETQMDLATNELNVESADFNQVLKTASFGHSWTPERVTSRRRHQASLEELQGVGLIGDFGTTNLPGKALIISFLNVRKGWHDNK